MYVAAEAACLDLLLSVGHHSSLSLKSHHFTKVQHSTKTALMHTGSVFIYLHKS